MRKSEAKALIEKMRDYIPNGKPADVSKLTFRPTLERGDLFLCGVQTGDDIQSGPYFCGKPADWVAVSEDGGTAAVCDRHRHRLGIRCEEKP